MASICLGLNELTANNYSFSTITQLQKHHTGWAAISGCQYVLYDILCD